MWNPHLSPSHTKFEVLQKMSGQKLNCIIKVKFNIIIHYTSNLVVKEDAKQSPIKIQVKGPYIPSEEDYQELMPLQQTVVQELNLQSQQKEFE